MLDAHASFIFMDLLEFWISRTPPESGSAPIGHVPVKVNNLKSIIGDVLY